MAIVVVATGNLGKLQEIEEYLVDLDWELQPKPDSLEVEETEDTFVGNACLKASAVAKATGKWAIADDSGLAVDALKGAPGIYSARYGKTDAERINRVLTELGDSKNRGAQFICAIALARPDGEIALQVEGICRGEILYAPRGTKGFGYDPIFYLPEHQLTFGEMNAQMKQRYSHRARAFQQLLPQLDKCQII